MQGWICGCETQKPMRDISSCAQGRTLGHKGDSEGFKLRIKGSNSKSIINLPRRHGIARPPSQSPDRPRRLPFCATREPVRPPPIPPPPSHSTLALLRPILCKQTKANGLAAPAGTRTATLGLGQSSVSPPPAEEQEELSRTGSGCGERGGGQGEGKKKKRRDTGVRAQKVHLCV